MREREERCIERERERLIESERQIEREREGERERQRQGDKDTERETGGHRKRENERKILELFYLDYNRLHMVQTSPRVTSHRLYHTM